MATAARDSFPDSERDARSEIREGTSPPPAKRPGCARGRRGSL